MLLDACKDGNLRRLSEEGGVDRSWEKKERIEFFSLK